ncbi:hypothetical protein VSR01_17515 [Actinacidiphila sp. DG2A-62]|uniref:hypothetical protein n=1 Tax=Actinacidiphila sp. DG2A-62 TaxID=3108821 RepID=UPI002DB7F535|nr:hypothetical protein [Actinacidiphila sp. DG2A-62]MEC3995238.1 hypothetical protein [Actinacidiphila sp. DG2A-62]
MPPRRRKPAPLLSVPPLAPSPLPVNGCLNWTSSEHWAHDARPCRYCGHPTHLRDDKGTPADKVCAEAALADVASIVQAYATQGQLTGGRAC